MLLESPYHWQGPVTAEGTTFSRPLSGTKTLTFPPIFATSRIALAIYTFQAAIHPASGSP